MFYKPEKYIIPSRRRQTKRIQLNNSKTGGAPSENFPKIREKLRENKNLIRKDFLDVKDINGEKRNHLQTNIKDIMNKYKLKGMEPKTTKPKRYDENNSFDYSDVNISRRVIRKMVQSTLFDHKPYERAKYLDKMSLGNKFISSIDPVDLTSKPMSTIERVRPLYNSVDLRTSSMSNLNDKLHHTIDYQPPNDRYNRSSRRQMSMYSNNIANRSAGSLNTVKSHKELSATAVYAGKPTRNMAFDINRNPYHKVQVDVLRNLSLASDKITNDAILGRNPLMQKSRHFRSNDRIFSNPYSNS